MAVVTVPLEGQRYLGDNPQVVKIAKCIVSALASTDALPVDVQVTAQTCYPIFSIPAGIFVLDVLARVNVAFTASVTLIVGDDTDDDGYLKSATIAPQSAVTTGLVKKTSLNANSEAYVSGKIYAAADTIDLVVGAANPVAGRAEFYLLYIEDQTQL